MVKRINWDRNIVGIIAIFIVFILFLTFSLPFENVPRIDDATYAWMANHLLSTGHFVPHEYVTAAAFTTTVAGAFFSYMLGASFTALHISTMVFSFFGILAFWYLARHWTGRGSHALLAVLILGCNSIYLYYSSSFMTDVPFTALTVISIYYYLTGIEKNSLVKLWIGSIFVSGALLTRQIGFFIFISAWIYACIKGDLFLTGKKNFLNKSLAIGLIPVLSLLAYEYWFYAINGITWGYNADVNIGVFEKINNPIQILKDMKRVFQNLGILTLPFLPGLILKSRKKIQPRVFLYITLVVFTATACVFISHFQAGEHVILEFFFSLLLSLFFGLFFWGLLCKIWLITIERGDELNIGFILILFVFLIGTSMLKTFFASYIIPLLPLSILLTIPRNSGSGPSKSVIAVASIIAALSLLTGITSSRNDFLRTSHRWDIAHELVASGVHAKYIDAGLEWNLHYGFDYWHKETVKLEGPKHASTTLWQKLLMENALFHVTTGCTQGDPDVTLSRTYTPAFGLGSDKTVCAVRAAERTKKTFPAGHVESK